jgi:hypothetical protein
MARNPWVAKWDVASYSDPDKEYTVAVRKDGTWGCSCPRWKFRRADLPNGECKHIEYLKAQLLQAGEHIEEYGCSPDEVNDRAAWESIWREVAMIYADKATTKPKARVVRPVAASGDLVLARKVRTRASFIEF